MQSKDVNYDNQPDYGRFKMTGTYQITYRRLGRLYNVEFDAKSWAQALAFKQKLIVSSMGIQCLTLVLVRKCANLSRV